MHELALSQSIVEMCSERAGEARVRRVTLEIGRLAGVMTDALRFSFDLVASGTALEGARLEIVEVAGLGRCRICGAEVDMPDFLSRCACGSVELECVAGDSLRVKEMEVV